MRRFNLYKKVNGYCPLHYREITVLNNESSSLSDFQICIKISDQDFLSKADKNNLLLVDDAGNVLPYWVESWKRPDGTARIWTKVDLDANESKILKLYYGVSLENPPNGDNVFEFFDDFDNDSLDLSKWTKGTQSNFSITVTNSLIKFSGSPSNSGYNYIKSLSTVNNMETVCKGFSKEIGNSDNQEIKFKTDDNNWFVAAVSKNSSGEHKWKKVGYGSGNSETAYYEDRIQSSFKLKIRKNNTNGISFYWDGFNWQTIGSDYTDLSSDAGNLTLGVYFSSGGHSQECYFDWIFTKKYTSNEPTISVGNEISKLISNYGNLITIEKSKYFTNYCRNIQVTNNESSALSNFQVPVEIGGGFLEKADPNNLVFMDGTSILPYWVESWKINGKAKIWIKLDLPASQTKYLKLYYNGYVNNYQDGEQVFEFFDDFDGTTLDTSKWSYNNNGSMSISNSFLKLTTGTTQDTYVSVHNSDSFSTPLVASVRKFCSAYSGTSDDRGATFYMYDSTGANSVHCTLFRYGHEYRIDQEINNTWQGSISLETEMKLKTIYKVDCIFNGSSVVINLKNDNDEQIATHTYSSFTFNPANLYLESYNKSSSVNCEGNFDWVYVRKYTSNFPSISVGSELNKYKVW